MHNQKLEINNFGLGEKYWNICYFLEGCECCCTFSGSSCPCVSRGSSKHASAAKRAAALYIEVANVTDDFSRTW